VLKLNPDSLDWALNHVETHGDTDILPLPFEYDAIRHSWLSGLRQFLAETDVTQWETRPFRRCLSPKHKFGFRVSTQLDPLDTLLFRALVYEIEAARLPS
jgi:hypothetical protein